MKRSLRNSYPKIIFPYEIAHIFNSIPPKIEIPDYPILPVKKEIQKPNEINIDSNGCLINSLIGFVITGIGIVLLKADIDFGVVFVPVGGAVTIYYVFFNQSDSDDDDEEYATAEAVLSDEDDIPISSIRGANKPRQKAASKQNQKKSTTSVSNNASCCF